MTTTEPNAFWRGAWQGYAAASMIGGPIWTGLFLWNAIQNGSGGSLLVALLLGLCSAIIIRRLIEAGESTDPATLWLDMCDRMEAEHDHG